MVCVEVSNGDIVINAGQAVSSFFLDANNVFVSAGGDVQISGILTDGMATVNSDGALNVNNAITADAVSLNVQRGVTVPRISAISNVILFAGDGDITSDSIISNSTLSLNSIQAVIVGDVVATGNATIVSGGQVDSNRVVSDTGSVTVGANGVLSATVVEAAVDATLTATFSDLFSDSVTAGNSAELASGAFLFTRNVEAPDVRLIAGTNQVAHRVIADTAEITAQIDLSINEIQADQLTIDAGDDIFDAGFLDGNRVTTDTLLIRAGNSNDEGTFGGIVLETDVNNLTAVVEGDNFGNIIIFEADDVVLGDIDTGNGRISVQAGGTITGGNIRARINSDQNDVRLTALGDGSDIRVNQIDVGNLGDVVLLADDDVVITGAGNQVTADVLFVNARNRSAGGTDGIALNSNVVTAQLIVGDENDASQNRGDIIISEASSLDLDFARTLFGTITATANGNLEAQAVISEGVAQADAISLTAQGIGADVVTRLVLVRERIGGVVLTAADDVRDSNLQDELTTIADSLSIVAGNNSPNDAFNGINSTSIVNSISATASGDGTVLLVNTGQLAVNQVSLGTGNISVINRSGYVAINDLTLAGTSNDDRVFVSTNDNFDIGIGRIDAGAGVVTIDSADDIFDTDLLDDLFIQAGLLVATSRNGTDDAFDGIALEASAEIVVLDAQGNGVEFVRQRA